MNEMHRTQSVLRAFGLSITFLTARVLIIYQVNYARNRVCLRNLWFLLSINQHFWQLNVEKMFFDGSCWLHWDLGTEVFREERFFLSVKAAVLQPPLPSNITDCHMTNSSLQHNKTSWRQKRHCTFLIEPFASLKGSLGKLTYYLLNRNIAR